MVNRYVKGARSERELRDKLHEMGYSVIRSAGSGVDALSPDLIALKNGKAICIECKAWDSGSIALDDEQYVKLLELAKNTSFPTYVAWRMPREGWYFIALEEFTQGKSNWNVTKRKVVAANRRLEDVLPRMGNVEVQVPMNGAEERL